ncbi:MAG: hypothetical protein ACFB0E_16530 [Leptolyngbyaceae cyanobacterium]
MGNIIAQPWQHWKKLRWIAIAALTAFLIVQFSPYAALARAASPVMAHRDQLPATTELNGLFPSHRSELLAQLQSLPNGRIGLPNFALNEDTFQFSNSELVSAIDLQRDAAAWEIVLTEQLEQLFGTQVCIGAEVKTCVLTAAAKDWLQTQLERLDLGIGEGMAAAVLALWQQNPSPQIPWWQQLINFLLGQAVFGLARSLLELQTYIANLFLMQGVTEVFQATQEIRETFTPTDVLLTVLDIFLTGSLNPFTMGIYRAVEGLLTDGHTLTPYQIEERGEGKYWVYVYDSNYPADRSNTPADLHVEFDTVANTWRYQPIANEAPFTGDAQSKNLDLTQLSWRQVESVEEPVYKGPFTCPFCNLDEPAIATEPTIDITLIGEGQLAVTVLDPHAAIAHTAGPTAVVPFKGGLDRAVPASYHLPLEVLDKPLELTLKGPSTRSRSLATLQITGPGYTADFKDLPLTPEETLTLYVVPTATGPELTFVSNRPVTIPKLAIYLNDESRRYEFDSSTATAFSLTERQVSKSSGFEISNLKLAAGKRVAMATKSDTHRLYFADDDLVASDYSLTVRNRIVIRDRIQVGERQPDFINYTLTYEEDLQAADISVDGDAQAYFDYDPAFVDPAEQSRNDLLTNFEQRNFPIAIAYEPLTITGVSGPLKLLPTQTAPMAERIFQGRFSKTAPK